MNRIPFFLIIFLSLVSRADCLSIVGKYTCDLISKEPIYIKSAVINGERNFKINGVAKAYEGKLVVTSEQIGADGNKYSTLIKNSCEDEMLVEYYGQQVPINGSIHTIIYAKKLYSLDQFGDLLILEGSFLFEIDQRAKFDINNPPAGTKKTNCYRESN